MKYIYWIFVLGTVILRRLIFPLIYLVIPLRKYIRNVIYNYHLNNGIILKRLWERNPSLNYDGTKWLLNGGTHSSITGTVQKRDVSKLLYWFILPMWLLLDDDANEDTYSSGFNETITKGERKKWMPKRIKGSLEQGIQDSIDCELSCNIKGNSFDLGDERARCPLFNFWSVFWWTLRNPAYNFNYKFNQLCDDKLVFKIVIAGRVFGWLEHGKLGNTQCYSWEFGKKDK